MSIPTRLCIAFASALLIVAGIGAPVSGLGDPSVDPRTCRFDLPSGFVEGETVECGYLVVPEDRADPDSGSIRLAFARFHPTAGATSATPVVYLEGGPGGSPLKLLAFRDFETVFGPVLDAGRELILIDQRGVGRSEPALDCPDFAELYKDLLDQSLDGDRLDGDEIRALKVDSLAACAEELSTDARLASYNSAESAADVEDLRRALGYEQLDLWGTSYGTWLALATMRDHPDAVRSAILDAPAPPQEDLYTATPDSFARALAELFAGCLADGECDAAYPYLEAVFLDAVARLDAEPVSVEVVDPFAGERVPLLIDGDTFLELVFRGLYMTAMRQALPGIVYDAREGVFDTLLAVAQLDILRQEIRSWGMYFSVLCHDEVPFSSAEDFETARGQHPELAGMYDHFEIGPLAFATCQRWGAGSAAPRENEPVHSAIPTLIMTGQYDPIVPPDFARDVAASLENATLLEFPGLSHGASGSPCATGIMLDFLDDPAGTLDTGCLADAEIQAFTLPAPEVSVDMEAWQSQDLGLAGLRPAGWQELAPGTFGRMQSGTDSTSLAILSLPFGVDEARSRIATSLGLADAPPVIDRIEANGLAWETYRADVTGATADLALASSDDATLIVILTSAGSERDSLYEQVFLPSVEALRLSSPAD